MHKLQEIKANRALNILPMESMDKDVRQTNKTTPFITKTDDEQKSTA